MKLTSKQKFSLVIITILTLYAFISSAVYFYPGYAYEDIDRDMYKSEGYYLFFVVCRGLFYGAILNGIYLIFYFIMKILFRDATTTN